MSSEFRSSNNSMLRQGDEVRRGRRRRRIASAVLLGAPLVVGLLSSARAASVLQNGDVLTLNNPNFNTNGLAAEFYNITPLTNQFTVAGFTSTQAVLNGTTPLTLTSGTVAYTPVNDPSNFNDLGESQNSNFIGRFSGTFTATTAGSYSFGLSSDDGSVLYIDGQQVVNDNFFQGINTGGPQQTGTISLTAGNHEIVIGYYQGTGGYGAVAYYTPPGGTQSVIPVTDTGSNQILSAPSGLQNSATNLTASNSGAGSADTSGNVQVASGASATIKVVNSLTTTFGTLNFAGPGSGITVQGGALAFNSTSFTGGAGTVTFNSSTASANDQSVSLGNVSSSAAVNIVESGQYNVVFDGGSGGALAAGSQLTVNSGGAVLLGSSNANPLGAGVPIVLNAAAPSGSLGANLYLGSDGGNVLFDNPISVSATGAIVAGTAPDPSGLLAASGVTVTLGSATNGISIASGATAQLSSSNSNTLIVAGGVSGAGSVAGTGGTVTLNGVVATTGGVSALGGTLALTNAGNTFTGGVSINGGLLNFASGTIPSANPITFAGSGTLQWATGNTQDISSQLASIPNGVTATLDVQGNSVTLASPVDSTGNGTIAKAGAGTLTLSGSTDNVSLGVVVNAGTLILAKQSSSPSVGGSDIHAIGGNGLVINGGTVQLAGTGGFQIYQGAGVTQNGGTFDLNGESQPVGAYNLIGGSIINSAAGSTATLSDTAAFNLQSGTVSAILSGGGGATISNGTVVLSANNTYTAATTVNSGTLMLSTVNNPLPPSQPLNMTGGVLDLGGVNQQVASLTGGTTAFITNSGSAASTLTVGGSSSTFSGAVVNGAEPVALALAGSGTSLTLTGANTFTGGINVPAGTSVVAGLSVANSTLGAGAVNLSGGSLKLQGQQTPGGATGLTVSLLAATPTDTNNTDPSFNTLSSVNAVFAGQTLTTVNGTLNGKDNLDYSNSGYGNNPLFGAAPSTSGDTTADYGFTSTTNLQARFTGYIHITTAGTYKFSTTSDDGSVIFINNGNNPVVNNNAYQGATTNSGSYTFASPGYYPITIGYYQGGGGQGLLVQWQPPGASSATTPTQAQFIDTTGTATLSGAQFYANTINVTADSNIDVSGSLAATLGGLTIGANTLSVTSADTSGSPYTLSFGGTGSTLTGNATVTVAASSGGGTGSAIFTTPIAGAGFGLTVGPGTVYLNAANTYTGTTHAASGGVLAGTGSIAGPASIDSGGALAPSGGSSTPIGGAFTISGALAVNPGGKLEVALASPSTPGTTYDEVLFGSTASISSGSTLAVLDSAYFTAGIHIGDKFFIMDGLSGSSPVTGAFGSNTVTSSDGVTYAISYNQPDPGGATNNDVLLTVTSTPEPTGLALAAVAGIGLLARRRRRR